MMIFNSFIPINDNIFRAQMLRGEWHLLSRVSVANQSAPTTLSTVLVHTTVLTTNISMLGGLVACEGKGSLFRRLV